MNGMLKIAIDAEIVLDEKSTKGMPEDLQGHLKAAITNAAKVYSCKWNEITWKVKIDKSSGLPYITTKKRA